MSNEDLIAEEDVVVTITRGGYAKRTKTDLYRAQRRGGKGVRGAQLRTDDIVDHFFVTTTHHWILFFTNKGRVYRAKAYELPDAGRDARGQHVANLLAFQPDERIAEVLALRDYSVAPYLVLATQGGLVKKSRLTDFDSPRPGGIIAINLREDDEVIAARLVSAGPGPAAGQQARPGDRFHATDEALRPMGRATSGVIGMRFADGDELLGMYVVREGADVLVATGGGYAKRTPADQYPVKGRGGMGVRDRQDRRGPGRAGRRAHGAAGGRGLRHHLRGRGDQDRRRRGQAVRAADDGRAADEPGRRAEPGRDRPQRRGVAGRGNGDRAADETREADADRPVAGSVGERRDSEVTVATAFRGSSAVDG